MVNASKTTTYNVAKPKKRVLVTGGAGYIGSHTTLALLQNGYQVVIIDNLCNSYVESVHRVRKLGGASKDDVVFVKADLNDRTKLEKVFATYSISSVIHFAGLKSVSESIAEPLLYYNNNVTVTCNILEVMQKFGCKHIVFSSSATVYGDAKDLYIKETAPVGPLTPYGRSKLMCEEIIRDTYNSDNSFLRAAILRYFNPVGCHPSGLIGENPRNAPNNLMPCVVGAMVSGKPMRVFGADYGTADGTAIRDFIHVCDLAEGHVMALRKLEGACEGMCEIYNMGNGTGSSVKQVLTTMEQVTDVAVPHVVIGRREGDAMCVVADPSKANKELGWRPFRDLAEMCESAWKWKSSNPTGYSTKPTYTKASSLKKSTFGFVRKSLEFVNFGSTSVVVV